jgi:hypothetical protein
VCLGSFFVFFAIRVDCRLRPHIRGRLLHRHETRGSAHHENSNSLRTLHLLGSFGFVRAASAPLLSAPGLPGPPASRIARNRISFHDRAGLVCVLERVAFKKEPWPRLIQPPARIDASSRRMNASPVALASIRSGGSWPATIPHALLASERGEGRDRVVLVAVDTCVSAGLLKDASRAEATLLTAGREDRARPFCVPTN